MIDSSVYSCTTNLDFRCFYQCDIIQFHIHIESGGNDKNQTDVICTLCQSNACQTLDTLLLFMLIGECLSISSLPGNALRTLVDIARLAE